MSWTEFLVFATHLSRCGDARRIIAAADKCQSWHSVSSNLSMQFWWRVIASLISDCSKKESRSIKFSAQIMVHRPHFLFHSNLTRMQSSTLDFPSNYTHVEETVQNKF